MTYFDERKPDDLSMIRENDMYWRNMIFYYLLILFNDDYVIER